MVTRVLPNSNASNQPAMGLIDRVASELLQLDVSQSTYVGDLVTKLLKLACETGASDVHFKPSEQELTVLWRVDGVLQAVASIPRRLSSNVIARLKVLADLLTYRTDVPQEGRLREAPAGLDNPEERPTEMRLSTFPTLYGEKGVVRIFAGSKRFQWPSELGLSTDLLAQLLDLLRETAGAIVIAGPAGSGKTTTAYACLREIQRHAGDGKSIVTLEDPIETVLPTVTQSQVNRAAGFDYLTGLRSLLRQDPDTILVGEIRDRETAESVFQASLTGHLVISTFHAGSAAESICRLNDMGIEPYLLRAGLRGILCQRLFRELCQCGAWSDSESDRLGYNTPRVRIPVGCPQCDGVGYRGRVLLAELLRPTDGELSRSILNRLDIAALHRLAVQTGMRDISQCTLQAISDGRISPAEARRVLGFGNLEGTSQNRSTPGTLG